MSKDPTNKQYQSTEGEYSLYCWSY